MPPRHRPFAFAFPTALLLGAVLAAPRALGQAADTARAPMPGATAAYSDPVLPDDAQLRASKCSAWDEKGPQGTDRFLLLEGGDAVLRVGAYGFTADRALVRVRTEDRPSGTVRHLTLYLENAKSGGDAQVGADAPRLLVTVSTSGKVSAKAELFTPLAAAPEAAGAFMADARRRMGEPAAGGAQPAPVETPPAADKTLVDRERRRVELAERRNANARQKKEQEQGQAQGQAQDGAPATAPDNAEKDAVPRLPALAGGGRGALRATAGHSEFVPGKDGQGDAVLLTGQVRLSWESPGHQVEIRAESAVIFLDRSANGQVGDTSKVRGIYLEDNAIVNDGAYAVRAPRVYYDIQTNRAVLLDAVLYAVDAKLQVPLYLRARVLRANAADSFEARGATLANNAFAEPSFAIGAGRLTVSQTPPDPGDPGDRVRPAASIQDATVRLEGAPVLWLPYAAVPGLRTPLQRFSASYGNNEGASVRSTWDVFGVLDKQAPPGEQLSANLDWRGIHGGALGADYKYIRDSSFGRLKAYGLPQDDGIDRIAGRDNTLHNGDRRDFLRFEHRHLLSAETELTVQAARASDPTMQETFFPDYGERPPETGAALKHQHEDWAVLFGVSMQMDDFTPSFAQLESRGYQTERAEAEFRRLGTEIQDGRGNWFSENRIGRVRAAVGRDAPNARGITAADSLADFGQANTVPFRSTANARGIPTDWVNRFDSRQEAAFPLQSGPLDVTPFALVRCTAWGGNVETPAGAQESRRLYAGGGVRLATELAGSSVPVTSEWLDINGLRHILRPECDLGYYASSMASGTLPMYDPDVEGLGEGGAMRLGLLNTWQTRRGEGNNRRVVDWLRFNQDVVIRRGVDDPARAVPRYVSWRPEYALGGGHAHSELLWQTTDALAASGESTYAFDSSRMEQWGLGLSFTHSDRLTTQLHYRETRLFSEQLVSYGASYQLTPKHHLNISQSFDLGPNTAGYLTASLDRRVPGGFLQTFGTYDELNGSYSIGIAFSPQGFGNGRIGQNLYSRQPR